VVEKRVFQNKVFTQIIF